MTNHSFIPQFISFLDKVGGEVVDIEIQGNFAYILDTRLGPQKIDIRDPFNTDFIAYDNMSDHRSVSRLFNPTPKDLEVEGNFIYVTGMTPGGLWKYGINEGGDRGRRLPLIDQWSTINSGRNRTSGLDIIGNLAYVTGYQWYDGDEIRDSYLSIINTNNGDILGTYFINHETSRVTFNDVDVINNRAYVAGGFGGLYVFDVSNPNTPTLINNIDLTQELDYVEDIEIVNNIAYVAKGNNLEIINVNDPNNPNLLGTYELTSNIGISEVKVLGNYAYLANDESGFSIINISDPTAPVLQGSYRMVSSSDVVSVQPITELDNNQNIINSPIETLAISGDYLYTGGERRNFVIDINGLIPSPVVVPSIDAKLYLASHNDLLTILGNNEQAAADHWFNAGFYEGRTITFDPLQYLASHHDILSVFGNNLIAATDHFINSGFYEQRQRDLFAEDIYLASHGDLIQSLGYNLEQASQHYINSGFREGRKLTFDPVQYLASHDDLLNVFGNNLRAATDHFINSGFYEQRQKDLFAEDIYLASYGDLIQSLGYNLEQASQHYVNMGASEGREKALFDPVAYLNNYGDLQAAFGNDLTSATRHYIESGFSEGRTWM